MRAILSRNEAVLTTAFAALLTLAILGPPLAQPVDYHEFADAAPWEECRMR
jgi:hypothetical protein